MSEPKSINLFYTEGSSDKVYNVQLLPSGDGWIVKAQNGRRGKSLTDREKTNGPTSYEAALKTYEKTVAGKTRDGYTEDESGAVFVGTDDQGRRTGYQPQLLNAISREEGDQFDENWLGQEKHDGERRGSAWHPDSGIVFSNRKGLQVGVQKPIHDAILALSGFVTAGFDLDSEDMGDHLVVFDVLAWPGMDPAAPFRVRAEVLKKVEDAIEELGGLGGAVIVDHPIPMSEFRKLRLPEIEARGGEGYVMKNPDAPLNAGRPASGGNALKVKFIERATCRVTAGREGKRSVGLELLDESGEWVGVGNVTIGGSKPLPEVGQLVDVDYLYAFPGGSLFQPVYWGVRDDIDENDCTLGQLKFKGSGMAVRQDPEEASGPSL